VSDTISEESAFETERLRLRPFRSSDAADVARLAGDRDIAATTRQVPHPYDVPMAEAWIASLSAQHERGELLTLAITLRATGDMVGAIGLIVNQVDHHAELGYWVGKPYWDNGYATEAARLVIDHAFKSLGLHRLFAHHFSRNAASGRVMQKLGMKCEGYMREHRYKFGRFEDLVIYGMTLADYLDHQTRQGK
jgi:[ribosomal protein S5]-alanine N-acetyltransferase